MVDGDDADATNLDLAHAVVRRGREHLVFLPDQLRTSAMSLLPDLTTRRARSDYRFRTAPEQHGSTVHGVHVPQTVSISSRRSTVADHLTTPRVGLSNTITSYRFGKLSTR